GVVVGTGVPVVVGCGDGVAWLVDVRAGVGRTDSPRQPPRRRNEARINDKSLLGMRWIIPQ
ncbi:MAG: hypothetical protein ACLFV5_12705, partial [Anaerolineales bacterium]